MAKTTVKENIVEKTATVPVEPSLRQFNIYGITPSSEFALYGTGSKAFYDMEIERVTNELRREVFYNTDSDEEVKNTKTEHEISENKAKKAKKVNGSAIFICIFTLLIAALYVLGKYIAPMQGVESLLYITNKAGLDVIFDLINVFLKGLPIETLAIALQIVVAAVALVSVIIVISSLIIVARPGIGKAMKILLLINFALTVAMGAIVFANKETLAIGYYILFGLTLTSAIVGLVSKKAVKQKR